MVIACPQLEDCQVTANITTVRADSTEYHAVQIAATNTAEKSTTKQMLGHFRKAGVAPKRIVKEFKVTPDAHVPIGASRVIVALRMQFKCSFQGTTLSACHFVPGQFVDVISNS